MNEKFKELETLRAENMILQDKINIINSIVNQSDATQYQIADLNENISYQITDLEYQYKQNQRQIQNIESEILQIIDKMSNKELIQFIYLRCILNTTWEYIVEFLNIK